MTSGSAGAAPGSAGGEGGPRNLALASAGATARASGTLPGFSIHRLEHVSDGRYGNSFSWISNTRGGWVEIELARPAARNAVDAAMQQALVDAFFVAEDATEIVLTGQGPVFSAGGDLDEFGTRSDPASAHVLRVRRSPARALARVADRTTVVVQGACHGACVHASPRGRGTP